MALPGHHQSAWRYSIFSIPDLTRIKKAFVLWGLPKILTVLGWDSTLIWGLSPFLFHGDSFPDSTRLSISAVGMVVMSSSLWLCLGMNDKRAWDLGCVLSSWERKDSSHYPTASMIVLLGSGFSAPRKSLCSCNRGIVASVAGITDMFFTSWHPSREILCWAYAFVSRSTAHVTTRCAFCYMVLTLAMPPPRLPASPCPIPTYFYHLRLPYGVTHLLISHVGFTISLISTSITLWFYFIQELMPIERSTFFRVIYTYII